MSARPHKGSAERRVTDDEIVGWVTPSIIRTPGEAASIDVDTIIKRHSAALQDALRKLAVHA